MLRLGRHIIYPAWAGIAAPAGPVSSQRPGGPAPLSPGWAGVLARPVSRLGRPAPPPPGGPPPAQPRLGCLLPSSPGWAAGQSYPAGPPSRTPAGPVRPAGPLRSSAPDGPACRLGSLARLPRLGRNLVLRLGYFLQPRLGHLLRIQYAG
jgi:hypothetical protein